VRGRSREWVGPVLIGLALLGLAPARAHACKSRLPLPVEVERPTWPEGTQLELVDEQIEIACDPGGVTRRCRWRALYVYEGSPGIAVDGELMLMTEQAIERVQLRVDGQAVPVQGDLRDPRHRSPTAFHVEDAGRVEIEIELEADIWSLYSERCMWAAGFARHLLAGNHPREITFVISPSQPPTLSPTQARLRAHAPPNWHVVVDEDRASRAHEIDASLDTSALHLVTLRNRPVAHGPLLGVGVGFGPQIRARLRAGYEVAAPPWLLYSLAVEGDAVEELMLIPAIEAALPSLVGVIPSGGIGVGAPVMLLPEPLAGVRTQLSLMWPIAGLLGSVDVYPRPGKPAVRGALMLQISI